MPTDISAEAIISSSALGLPARPTMRITWDAAASATSALEALVLASSTTTARRLRTSWSIAYPKSNVMTIGIPATIPPVSRSRRRWKNSFLAMASIRVADSTINPPGLP